MNCITFPFQASPTASLDPYVQGSSPEDWFRRDIGFLVEKRMEQGQT